MAEENKKTISLNAGNGGAEMNELLSLFVSDFYRGNWKNCDNDSANFKLSNGEELFFTSDSYVVKPIEFKGKNIGHLAICGTVNDLVVMGCEPIGISLSIVVEEGFEEEKLKMIVRTINDISKSIGVPVVTGDTKVMEKGSVDGIIINTTGVGIGGKVLEGELEAQDKIIISGGIGEHGVALLSDRFDFETSIESDSKALLFEMRKIRDLIKIAKDPTRGGVSACINEIALKNNVEIELFDEKIPIKKEVKSACKLLGLDVLELANEGKVLIVCSSDNSSMVLEKLQEFNEMAAIIGEVKRKDSKGFVTLKTELGSRILSVPSGRIVPRIC